MYEKILTIPRWFINSIAGNLIIAWILAMFVIVFAAVITSDKDTIAKPIVSRDIIGFVDFYNIKPREIRYISSKDVRIVNSQNIYVDTNAHLFDSYNIVGSSYVLFNKDKSDGEKPSGALIQIFMDEKYKITLIFCSNYSLVDFRDSIPANSGIVKNIERR